LILILLLIDVVVRKCGDAIKTKIMIKSRRDRIGFAESERRS
jgi:hypothetical protein